MGLPALLLVVRSQPEQRALAQLLCLEHSWSAGAVSWTPVPQTGGELGQLGSPCCRAGSAPLGRTAYICSTRSSACR